MAVRLRPLTEAEFNDRNSQLIDDYAQSLLGAGRAATIEQALARARQQNTDLLPHGVATEGMLLLAAHGPGPADQPVGWVWIGLPEATGFDAAWLYYLYVDPEHRGSGYGRALVEAVERLLAEQGVPRMGLNVFTENQVALRLYERLGFTTVTQQMTKDISLPTPT